MSLLSGPNRAAPARMSIGDAMDRLVRGGLPVRFTAYDGSSAGPPDAPFGLDLHTERGVECPGDLPAPSDPDLVGRARAAKATLGDKVFVLGHHYQRDEVIEFADVMGDSFKLARDAAARPDAPFACRNGVCGTCRMRVLSGTVEMRQNFALEPPDLAAGFRLACQSVPSAAVLDVDFDV